MAVPKKKHSKQRTRIRHSAWQQAQRKRLENDVNIVTCSSCGARIPERTACSECGKYKGVQIIDKTSKKDDVTVVSA